MKPFDLEAAKRGEPIQTRDGRAMKFVAHVPEAVPSYRVVCMYDSRIIEGFGEDGRLGVRHETDSDLFMAPKKYRREVWVNLYEDGTTGDHWWDSEEAANNYAFPSYKKKRIGGKAARVVIEWEE